MTDDALQACSLSKWAGDAARCRWCDTALTGRQQRWCSPECARSMVRNHWWTAARVAARKRDGDRCVRCGSDGETRHGRPLPRRLRGLQVHHRDERARGRHAQSSCAHHVDGLETLCKPDHLDEHHGVGAGQTAIEVA